MADSASPILDAILHKGILAGQVVADEIRKKVLALVRRRLPRPQLLNEIRRVLMLHEPLLARTLSDGMLASWLTGADTIASKLPALKQPPPWFNPPRIEFRDDDEEPIVRFPQIEKAAHSLASKRLVTPEEYHRLDARARAAAFTVAKVASYDALEKIQDALVNQIEEGGTLKAFRDFVDDTVGKSAVGPWQIETAYRTYIGQAQKEGQLTVLNHRLVSDEFPYCAYEGIHDERRRPEHKWFQTGGIQGTNLYRRDDPTIIRFWAPWDFNCRCEMVAITLDDAAAKGIREAEEWQRTGLPPSRRAWIPPPPFNPPPEFQRTVLAAA